MAEPTSNQDTTNLAPAGHDVHLYDPSIHDNQIVAVYDTMQQAQAAQTTLQGAGVDGGMIELIDGNRTGVDQAPDSGFWGAVKSLFAPDEEALAFRHAMGRGHAMLIVHPGQAEDRTQIIRVLEETGPLDFDAKLEEWRQSGYDYSHAGQSSLRTETPTGTATGTSETAMGAVMAAGTGGAMMAGSMPTDPDTNSPARLTDITEPSMGDNRGLEERLRIGKREHAPGTARVRSYVAERPSDAQVRLHEERIGVRTPAESSPFSGPNG